jgi:hypothetical protein
VEMRRPTQYRARPRRSVALVVLVVALLLAGCGGQGGTTATVPTMPTMASTTGAAGAARRSFDGDPAGAVPPGMTVFSGSWAVRAEPGAPSAPNALCQTGTAEFPALALDDATYTDVILTAQVKPIAGKTDRAAGLIARIQDKDNYYILRANALENNVNLYKYVGGKRDVIKEGRATVPAGQWQELRLEVAGNHLRGSLNGQPVVEATDDTFAAGTVGLWTKADSQTCFDDVDARVP